MGWMYAYVIRTKRKLLYHSRRGLVFLLLPLYNLMIAKKVVIFGLAKWIRKYICIQKARFWDYWFFGKLTGFRFRTLFEFLIWTTLRSILEKVTKMFLGWKLFPNHIAILHHSSTPDNKTCSIYQVV